jgi:putative addiction module killer protein
MANPQKALERIHAATGISFRGHDLRRTAASMMTGVGIPRLTVSKILNHVEPGVAAVYEYKIDFGPGYRIYFGKDGETIVILLGGGTKRLQNKDIEIAQYHWNDYKRRKAEEK